jgi:phage I-like protein
MVSAPVSRESYGSGGGGSPGRVKLTQQQAEMARLAGISEAEYAKQLRKLNEMKASGDYSERR